MIAKRLEEQYPDSNRGQGASVVTMAEADFGTLRPILLVLMGGAALLLLIDFVCGCGCARHRLAASFVPARRAACVNPMEALRTE